MQKRNEKRTDKIFVLLKATKWFSLSLIIVVLVACLALLFCRTIGIVSNVSVSPIEKDWMYTGPIEQWTLGISDIKKARLTLVEKYAGRSDPHFANDVFYITAFSLSDGKRLYRRKLMIGEYRLQVAKIWAWRENTVLWGYHQERPGHMNRIVSITIFDSQGNPKTNFPVMSKIKAVDQKNDILICASFPIKLPSGDELLQTKFELMVDAETDSNGNAFILRRVKKKKDRYDTKDIYDSFIEKYSTVTWEKHWSVRLTGVENAYAIKLRYDNGLLWYAMFVKLTNTKMYRRQTKWLNKPIDTQTSHVVEDAPLVPPPRSIKDINGKRYAVSREGEGLIVRIVTD
jgi:hypothetical protein